MKHQVEAQFVELLKQKAYEMCGNASGMGEMEKALERSAMPFMLEALERMTQETAQQIAPLCTCGESLQIESLHKSRNVRSRFGSLRFSRAYGFCRHCKAWQLPADIALGLHERARSSPRIQEFCALTTLRAPAVHAQDELYRLTGVNLDPGTIHSEARRQGERAILLRDADVQLSETTKGRAELCARAPAAAKGATLVIEIDAWLIRERDQWGESEMLQKAAETAKRWHWVYTATFFRLDQRATLDSGRPVISERAYLATRMGLEAFRKQLYAEALVRGASQAQNVLVLGDGATWIWNIAQDRFKDATHRVDLYHVIEHLWSIAHDIHGRQTKEANEWIRPYLSWLKRRKDGAADVINGLHDLLKSKVDLSQEQIENLQREIGYFENNRKRMDDKRAKQNGQPMGSGAIESTCSQYQGRFKLRGQFWSTDGDEALLALWSLYHNNRWNQLFPDVPSPAAAA